MKQWLIEVCLNNDFHLQNNFHGSQVVINLITIFSLSDTEGNAIWRLTLPPIEKIDSPYRIIATSTWKGEKVEAVLDNILFGDVWLCSGQSNMGFTVGMVKMFSYKFSFRIINIYCIFDDNF